MQDQPKHESIARRAYEIWESEGRPDGRHEEHWARAESESRATGAADLAYGEMEQPGAGHPRGDGALPEASAQAGEGNPDPDPDDGRERPEDAGTRQRVDEPADGESEAPMQDGEGAGRPGRGIYAGP